MHRYRFGDFELDLDACELRRNGQPVKLERRPLDLLALLVRQPGRMVPRDEIIAALWPPNVIVEFDAGVNTVVRKVRRALGDSTESPAFIETVPGRGYRFVAPVALVAGGEQPLADAAPGAAVFRRRGKIALTAAVLLLATVAVTLFMWARVGSLSGPARIVVLPFDNLTGQDSLAYLASGLADDTSTSLARIDPANLRVVGVPSRSLEQAGLSVAEMGHSLGVDFVVASSLQLDRSRIRINARLLRVSDSEQIWSASLDRELTNVLGLQRELSTAIAEQVRLRLSPEVAAAIDRLQTQNPAAYALYLKGRYEWSRLTPASTRRALEYFEQATVEDPDYALAWAGLAFGLTTSIATADISPAMAVPLAREALRRAQQLGPELAETAYAAGYQSLFLDLDAVAAERAARRAIEIDPNNAQAHVLLGVTLPELGQAVEGREMMRRARELDPTFELAFANSANVALQSGDRAGALEFAQQTIAINPEFWLGHYYLAAARDALGDVDGALAAYADAARLSGGHSLTYRARAELLVRLGRQEEVRSLLDEMTSRAMRQYIPPYAFAIVNAALGDTDSAFEWLDKAVDARDFGLWSLATDTRLFGLHEDPRFVALLERCGCPQEPDRAL